jgi:hypothetical protein
LKNGRLEVFDVGLLTLEKQELNQSNFANMIDVGFFSLNLDKDPSWHVMGDVNTFSTYNKNIDPIKIK